MPGPSQVTHVGGRDKFSPLDIWQYSQQLFFCLAKIPLTVGDTILFKSFLFCFKVMRYLWSKFLMELFPCRTPIIKDWVKKESHNV